MNYSLVKNKTMNNIDEIFSKFIIIYPFFLMVDTKLVLNFFNIFLFILTIIKVKKDGFKKSFLENYIYFFILGILVSFIKSPYEIDSGLVSLKRMLRWIFFPLLLGQFYIKEKTKKYLLYSAGLGLSFYGIRFYLEISKIWKFKLSWGERFSGGYWLSQISLILGICLVLGLILFCYKKILLKERIILTTLIIVSGILLILTQTRGVYLAVLLGIPLVLFVKNIKHFILVSIIGLLMGIILLSTTPTNKYVARAKTITRIDNSNLGRIEVWKEAYRIFKENPINGVGYNNFSKAQREGIYKYNEKYYHPHNAILKFASETGVLGLLGYLLLNGVLILKGIKNGKNDLNYLVMLGIILCLLIYELSEIIIWINFAYPCIYFALGVLLNSEYKKIKFR